MAAVRPPPPAAMRLVLAVGGGRPAAVADTFRQVVDAGVAEYVWTGHRRTRAIWDDADGTIAATGAELSTSGGIARLTVADGPLRSVVHAIAVPDDIPPLLELAQQSGHDLPDHVRIVARCTETGRTAAMAGGAGRIAVEATLRTTETDERRGRRIVVDCPPETAVAALLALQALPGRVRLRPVSGLPAGDDPVRVAPDGIAGDATAGQAMLATARAALRQVLGNLDRIADGPTPEAVHQFRVGVRRLRAALSLFRDCLDPDERAALAARLKDVAGRFGSARDLDVFGTETLAPLQAALEGAVDLSPAETAVAAAREAARADLARTVWSPDVARTLLDLIVWFEAEAAPLSETAGRPVRKFARRALRRRRRRLLAHHAAGPESVDEWHALRIEAKKLRYATDAFARLYPPEATRPFVRALQEVQDCLGRYNDAAVAATLAGRLNLDGAAAAAVAGWTARERVEQERRFVGSWRRLRKCRHFW